MIQQRTRHKKSTGRCQRGGYVYIAVLFTSLIVTASVAAALSLSTGSIRSDVDRIHRESALRLAETELHRMAASMNRNSSWRSQRTNNAFTAWVNLSTSGVHSSDTAQVRYRVTDADGDLTDDLSDSVELTTHAVVGDSESAVTVTLEPRFSAESILRYGITTTDDIKIEGGGAIACELPVQVHGDVEIDSGGLLTAPVLQCSGIIQPTFRGNLDAADVHSPTHDVVDQYVQVGTQILISSLPLNGADRVIEDVVLSATENPYGAVNGAGVYWIDAGFNRIRISNCRIAASLAIKNASEVEIREGIVWTYSSSPEAILVSDSDIKIKDIDSVLSESVRATNFNPATTPYRQTMFNGTITDEFPSELRGIIYTTANLQFELADSDLLPITGSLFCHDLQVQGSVMVRQLDEVLETPPLGLINKVPLRFVRGTFRRIPTP